MCRSVYQPCDGAADLFPSDLHQQRLSNKKGGHPSLQEPDVYGYADSGFQNDFPSITTSTNTSPILAQPILIPKTPANRRDPDRVPTPVSGRGDRKGHLFPIKGSSPTKLSHFSTGREDVAQTISPPRFDHTYHHRSLSLTHSPRSRSFAMIHADRAASRYTPTSPLSPRLGGGARPISPQPFRARGQPSRPMNIPTPKYYPLHFQHQRDMPTTSTAASHKAINYTKQSSTTESPKLMKERQRELIDKAKMSSRIAASPLGVKPNAPRLDPLGSPKGPVTPLALEEGGDYFLFAGSGENSCGHSGLSERRIH